MAFLMLQLARVAMEYSCFSRPAETILAKCARFLKIEISRNFGILKLLSKDDYEIFQVATLTLYFTFQFDSCEKLNLFLSFLDISIFTFAILNCIKNACSGLELRLIFDQLLSRVSAPG